MHIKGKKREVSFALKARIHKQRNYIKNIINLFCYFYATVEIKQPKNLTLSSSTKKRALKDRSTFKWWLNFTLFK